MAIAIVEDKCRGCRKCLKVCPFDALEMDGSRAVINDKCTACGQCLEVCPFEAIIREAAAGHGADLSGWKDVWVFAEQRQGELLPVTLELLGEGRRLASELGGSLCAVAPGGAGQVKTEELFAYGAEKVYLIEDSLLNTYTTDGFTKVITDAVRHYRPEVVLFGATHIGRDLAPRIAARLDTGLTADCTKLVVDSENRRLLQTRPAFGGNLMATIVCPATRPQMATVRPGVMAKREPAENPSGAVIALQADLKPSDIRTTVREIVKTVKEAVNLSEAEIICSGGRGLGSAEGFELLRELAEKTGGYVGASRAAVDSGWIDHSRQVGQTGTTVRPKIYFACGISGAIQHLAGMQDSDVIIAINKDPDAPIFEIADYALVGDLYELIPQIVSRWSA